MYNIRNGKKILCEKRVTDVDNRDEETTWLWFSSNDNQHYVEINPWSLVSNVIDNGQYDDTTRESFIENLNNLQQQVSEANERVFDEDLTENKIEKLDHDDIELLIATLNDFKTKIIDRDLESKEFDNEEDKSFLIDYRKRLEEIESKLKS